MKHLITLALCLFFTSALSAQFDYQLFRPDVQYLYENYRVGPDQRDWDYLFVEESPILGMKVDERECQTLYRAFSNYDCPTLTHSFAGYEICQSPGFTVMYLGESYYFRLQTQGAVGSNWVAGMLNGTRVNGKVTAIDTMGFLGLLDTVKTISFYHHEVDTLFGDPMVISKNYGLVSSPRIGVGVRRPWAYGQGPITLLGISSPQVGLQNYSDEEVFDLQHGDVLHHLIDGEGDDELFAVEITSVVRSVEEDTEIVEVNYAGKSISPGTIVVDGETVDTVILQDISGTWTYSENSLEMLRRQPGEAYQQFPEFSDQFVVAQMFTPITCGLAGKRIGVPLRGGPSQTGCFVNSESWDGSPDYFFYPGLGGGYGRANSETAYKKILQYANTDRLQCGEPFDYEGIVTRLTNTTDETNFTAYPNPATDEINLFISTPGNFQLTVVDQLGRNALSVEEVAGQATVSVEKLPAGIYHLLLVQEGSTVGRKRLVVE